MVRNRRTENIKNRGRFSACVAGIALIAVLLQGLSVKAEAASQKTVVKIPVSQTFEIKNQVPDGLNREFQYIMTCEEAKAPMPEETSEGTYTFTLKDNEKKVIEIAYEHAGVYYYNLKQQVSDKKEKVSYDETNYKVAVYVTNADNGGLDTQVVVKNPDGTKSAEAFFHNSYTGDNPAKGNTIVKTGDTQNIILWCSIAAIAVAVFFLAVFIRRKKCQ